MEPDPRHRAWVTLATPWTPDALWIFLQDPERLCRINPYWHIMDWSRADDGRHCLRIRNEWSGETSTWTCRITRAEEEKTISITYDDGPKLFTRGMVQPGAGGKAVLLLEEYYRFPLEQGSSGVDHTLIPWGGAIHRHLVGMTRWGWLPGYRWYVNRIHLTMPPVERRMVRLLALVSLLEFVVFVGALMIYLSS